ncbi:uncharacterized protein (DUF2062 family) [Microbacterium foliorum]|jgi:hypothetical protein|uniref:Uncharacterized protein (DUF2062 family) n=1 Tax=Microbacterium foliorum TaxID=104336 RepID=A0ABU1HT14_9MICO|nr:MULTISPECIES: DUF6069 family protein [Microbacterium]KIP95186.1 hypothetical protein RU09_01805 [Microbacterium sp. MEJ108Y]MDR6143185.1 uncharacterized protein (DUF2062 family) [Microbacterium foliorum]
MVTTTARGDRHATGSRLRRALILAAAVAIAIAANSMVALIAVAAGAPTTYGPLTFPAFSLFTTVGVVAGWIGWSLVRRHARDPRRTLTMVVPIVTVASFVPDVLLLALRFIPGTTVSAVIALMVMHLVVVAVAVPAYMWASRSS